MVYTELPLTDSIIRRFFRWVDKTESCWLWIGAGGRYGTFSITPQLQVSAHKVAYCIYHGSIPEGKIIMHTCDVGKCVAEAHLIAGTVAENTQDAYDKGLVNHRRGEGINTAVLDEEGVLYLRVMAKQGYKASELAAMTGLKRQTIQDVIVHRTWRHVDTDF